MNTTIIKVFLRFSIGIGFLSAVADRFGLWPEAVSAWGNWDNFLEYTQLINPLLPEILIPTIGTIATAAELVFGICLLFGLKTTVMAKMSGYLLLLFALAISFSTGLKGALDYAVFAASAAAFALSVLPGKYLELEALLVKKNKA